LTGVHEVPTELAPEFRALGLSVGHSCRRLLYWECQAADKRQLETLALGLVARGYRDGSRSPFFRELWHPDEHSVLIVPRTGRVQIRVHYLTPLAEREAEARRVFGDIAACLEPAGAYTAVRLC